MTEEQINKLVKERYPVTDSERKCRTDRAIRNKLREEYREKLRQNMQVTTKEGETK